MQRLGHILRQIWRKGQKPQKTDSQSLLICNYELQRHLSGLCLNLLEVDNGYY